MIRRTTHALGFTLIEVLVTLAIVAIVFAMIGGILISVISVQDAIAERSGEEKIGHGVLALLVRDFEGCVGYGLGPIIFKVEDKSAGGRDGDTVSFITTTPGEVYAANTTNDPNNGGAAAAPTDPNKETQAQKRARLPAYRKVSYTLRDAPSEGQGEERFILVRRVLALTGEERDPSAGTGPYVEVVDGLRSFKIELKETPQSDWKDGWQDPSKLPAAVRITIETAPSASSLIAAREGDRPIPEPRRFQTFVSFIAASKIVVKTP